MNRLLDRVDFKVLLAELKEEGFQFERLNFEELSRYLEYVFEFSMNGNVFRVPEFDNSRKCLVLSVEQLNVEHNSINYYKNYNLREIERAMNNSPFSLEESNLKYTPVWQKVEGAFRTLGNLASGSLQSEINDFVLHFIKCALESKLLNKSFTNYLEIENAVRDYGYLRIGTKNCADSRKELRLEGTYDWFSEDTRVLRNRAWMESLEERIEKIEKLKKHRDISLIPNYRYLLETGELTPTPYPVEYSEALRIISTNSNGVGENCTAICISVRVLLKNLINQNKLKIYDFITGIREGNIDRNSENYEEMCNLVSRYGSLGSKEMLRNYESGLVPGIDLEEVEIGEVHKIER